MQEEIEDQPEGPVEIAIVGDMTEHGADLTDKLLSVPQGGECIIYFDSPGGSPYCGLSLMNLIVMRQLLATGIVTGECSSAALWPLAACARRVVTPYSVLLFHPMRWQSDESVQLSEAAEWARHFAHLEGQMDRLLADMFGIAHDEIEGWVRPGTYVSGPEFAAAGLAELVDVVKLAQEFRKRLET
ncbi:MAG: ATP-dependent Clp protease proteolytic subunit [Planctomycetota bacterium]|nr:ATP-dependent Clp protease proteolytic subunit [Planctomycetota bacterium]